MQVPQNILQTTPNGQHSPGPFFIETNDPAALAALLLAELGDATPGRTVIEMCSAPAPLTPKAALTLAALACRYLLTGQPEPCTFDPADLELAIPLLDQMAATVKPASGEIHQIEGAGQ